MSAPKKNGDAGKSHQVEAAVLTVDKLRAHAGTLAQVHAMLAPEAIVADGTTQLVPADISKVLLARQFLQALHADIADAVADAERAGGETTGQPIDDAVEQPQRLN